MKICIVGCEKSGTSAISALLSIGSGWSLLDDPRESWYAYPVIYITGHGLTFRLWLKLRRHKIVKVPGFATILPYLRKCFLGNFTTLYCLRDPRDVAASFLERLEHGYSGLLTDISWLDIWKAADVIEVIAWRWRKYLECARKYHAQRGKILFLKYEDFYTNRLNVTTEFAKKMDIPFNYRRIEPHLNTQFRKSWSKSIKGPGRWKKDLQKTDIQKIITICGNLMNTYKYKF